VNLDPLFLSRIQFAFTVSFHIVFPSVTIGLAVWLAVLQGLHLATRQERYQRLFAFWLKVFALLFVMGTVSGIVMAFQFGMNWSRMSSRMGPVLGPLLGYETLAAFMLEATFLGVVLYARRRVPDWFYLLSCCLIAFGTVVSSFWILVNNTWMQMPVGYEVSDGRILPVDWRVIVFGPVFLLRWLHMLLAAFLTTALCIAAAGAWFLLRRVHAAEGQWMMRWGLGVTAVLIVLQILIGDWVGKDLYRYQPVKFAAIEARWHPEQPGRLVWIGIPDEASRSNRLSFSTPYLGSWIATGDWRAPVSGLSDFPAADWPPVLLTFVTFRLMFGLGVVMLALSWLGLWLDRRRMLAESRWFLWGTIAVAPSGFLAVILGWCTAEVGRQPWAVYGLMRTAEALTPNLSGAEVLVSLLAYLAVYTLVGAFGAVHLCGILNRGLVAGGDSPDGPPLPASAARRG
jgi:cytochrome d ubiquinol oxidase subunit I